MAFTSTQLLSISKILGITPTLLDAHITSLGATLTTAKETDVIARIADWTTYDLFNDYSTIDAKDKNFGFSDDPEDLRKAIRKDISVVLEMNFAYAGSTKIGTLQIG